MESAKKLVTKNDIYGYTWTEIARVMNIDEATVRYYYDRGIEKFTRNWLRLHRKQYDEWHRPIKKGT